MVSNSVVGTQSQIRSELDPTSIRNMYNKYTDIWVCGLDPTFEEKWVRPRIIVSEGMQLNVGSTPGLDVGSGPHSSMGTRPMFLSITLLLNIIKVIYLP